MPGRPENSNPHSSGISRVGLRLSPFITYPIWNETCKMPRIVKIFDAVNRKKAPQMISPRGTIVSVRSLPIRKEMEAGGILSRKTSPDPRRRIQGHHLANRLGRAFDVVL